MTRDEVLCVLQSLGIESIDDEVLDDFTHVAELAAAAERERLNKKIAALEADVDHFFKLSGQYLERANKAEEAVAAERERMVADGWRQCAAGQKTTQHCGLLEWAVATTRERCAKVCESYGMPDGTSETALALAAAIRGMK